MSKKHPLLVNDSSYIKHIVVIIQNSKDMEPGISHGKSTGFQEEDDMSMPDAILFHVLASNKKISKLDAGCSESGDDIEKTQYPGRYCIEFYKKVRKKTLS